MAIGWVPRVCRCDVVSTRMTSARTVAIDLWLIAGRSAPVDCPMNAATRPEYLERFDKSGLSLGWRIVRWSSLVPHLVKCDNADVAITYNVVIQSPIWAA